MGLFGSVCLATHRLYVRGSSPGSLNLSFFSFMLFFLPCTTLYLRAPLSVSFPRYPYPILPYSHQFYYTLCFLSSRSAIPICSKSLPAEEATMMSCFCPILSKAKLNLSNRLIVFYCSLTFFHFSFFLLFSPDFFPSPRVHFLRVYITLPVLLKICSGWRFIFLGLLSLPYECLA